MTYDPGRDKVVLISAAFAAAGVALMILPPRSPPIARFPVAMEAVAERAATTGLAPAVETPTDLSRLAAMFDLSDLPATPPRTLRPSDPAAELKRFRFAGAALAGERRSALFDAGGDVRTLRAGDALAGFILNQIESDRAVFVKDDLEVVLPLAPQ